MPLAPPSMTGGGSSTAGGLAMPHPTPVDILVTDIVSNEGNQPSRESFTFKVWLPKGKKAFKSMS